jgi:hypothetical protein
MCDAAVRQFRPGGLLMAGTALKGRIEHFRREYLDTPTGRAHYSKAVSEEKEVQSIYASLVGKRNDGTDITDEVLKQLLPHANTSGNRQRGARTSTWPCITKDIRMWFEGARWKKPSEWPDAARWLLDVANAGAAGNWSEWVALAQKPIQRGFACGFITPIVHCLSPNLPVINSKVVKTYAAVAAELGLDSEISPALVEYPENQKKITELVAALQSYGIKDLREFDIYCHWNIDRRLGGSDAGEDQKESRTMRKPATPPQQPQAAATPASAEIDTICKELQEAQSDTQNPKRFETAVAAALKALGCDAEHIGGSGDADVFADAPLGEDRFSFVVDAKTCQAGGTKASINYQPLKKHQELHEADFVIVVAASFAGGNTMQFAEESSIGLLTTETLVALVRHHATVGLSLYELKDILSKPGLIDPQLELKRKAADDRQNVLRGVLSTFDLHQRQDESSAGLTAQAIYWLLRGQGHNFTEDQVVQAVALLANPILGILESRGDGYVLALPAQRVTSRFEFLLNALSAQHQKATSQV